MPGLGPIINAKIRVFITELTERDYDLFLDEMPVIYTRNLRSRC